ncbi:MAG: hypothetical protein KF812_08390 [Fimbriimonadaceae bacterium]|nr:hypothetical protein [Fimbriimonadaceae bacterium]
MNGPWVLAGIGLAVSALVIWRLLNGKRVHGYLADTEYWIYTHETRLPAIDKVMDRMVGANPHHRAGRPCIGAREGMIFSDIRLDIALAKREKNPFAFRPDLFSEDVVPTSEQLTSIADAKAIIKIRYSSRSLLKDDRHLQFMAHLADSMSDLANGTAVFDRITGQVWTSAEFKKELEANNNGARPSLQIRVFWKCDGEVGRVLTRGLRKVGLAELESLPLPPDQEVLATGLMMRLAHEGFRKMKLPNQLETEEYEDQFILEVQPAVGVHKVKILRTLPS